MAARKPSRKAEESPEDRAQKRGQKRAAKLHERPQPKSLAQGVKQMYQPLEDDGDPDDPTSRAGIQRIKQRDDERMRATRESLERSAVESAGGDLNQKTPDVFVAVARDKRAAIDMQKRIDASKNAPGVNRYKTAPQPGEAGYKAEPMRPTAEEGPQPYSAAPRGPNAPEAPSQEELGDRYPDHIRYEGFDDITPSGAPIVRGEPVQFVEPDRNWDGQNDRDLRQVVKGYNPWPFVDYSDEEPEINRHSPEGARLDEMKRLKPVKYVPPGPLPEEPDDPLWNDIRRRANAKLRADRGE